MTLSTFIGSALGTAVILSFIWWLAALSKLRAREQKQRDERNDRIARLKAFSRDCVTHGDMTPGAKQMLERILESQP